MDAGFVSGGGGGRVQLDFIGINAQNWKKSPKKWRKITCVHPSEEQVNYLFGQKKWIHQNST